VKPLVYDFHGLVGLHVTADDSRVRAYFADEYGFHSGDPPNGVRCVRLSWTKGRDGLRPHQHRVLARWRSRVELDGKEARIEAHGNRLAIPMVHHMLVHPSLRYLVSEEGGLLLHAASAVRGGRSLVLTGAGGAGKTTISALLLGSGDAEWQLHGDDYVFLTQDGRTRAYITRAHLYRSLTEWLPEVRRRLTPAERRRLEILGRIREWSDERIKWPVRVPLGRLWPGRAVAAEAQPAAVVILRRGRSDTPRLQPVGAASSVVRDLIDINFGEARHFVRLVWGTDGWERPEVTGWKEREQGLLARWSEGVPFYWLELPPPNARSVGLRDALIEILGPLVEARA
jgi:hypothetical protein